jgi:hypothetical protein
MDIGNKLVYTFEFLGSSTSKSVSSAYYDYYAEANVKASTLEYRFGAKYIFDATPEFHPYVVAGPVIITGTLDASYADNYGYAESGSSSGNGFGYWMGGGMYYTISKHFNLGTELSYSNADVQIAGETLKGGGTHVNFFIGYHF